jgi:hypothetical protein
MGRWHRVIFSTVKYYTPLYRFLRLIRSGVVGSDILNQSRETPRMEQSALHQATPTGTERIIRCHQHGGRPEAPRLVFGAENGRT